MDSPQSLAESLLSTQDSSLRASLVAAEVVERLGESACVIYRAVVHEAGISLLPAGSAGPVEVDGATLSTEHLLPATFFTEETGPLIYSGASLPREHYAHLHITRTIASIAYLAFFQEAEPAGLCEVLTFNEPLTAARMEALAPVFRLAGPAIVAATQSERQKQDLLDSVHRMSQLYDLEKSLNATLELDQVTAMIPEKTASMLPCQAVHLWLFDGSMLRLMDSYGDDATVAKGMTQAAGEGYVADMAEEGDPLRIDDADDARFTVRNSPLATLPEKDRTPPVANALLVPLMQDEAEVGVLEAINKAGDTPFDDDDEFYLTSMAETISSALKNASLMHAERKLEILEALVHVSSEITSTLRLDRLLQILVNSPQNVLSYERCAIALDNRGTLQLKAVSGMATLPHGDAQVSRLEELIRWLSTQNSVLHPRLSEDPAENEKLPPQALHHFEESGMRAFYALPLNDDQGRVGLLLYEAGDPDFLDLPHVEMIKILAGQATVAIRNALLYREVPLIGLLEPLMQRKQAWFRTTRTWRLIFLGGAALVLLFLVLCPLPMRVSGAAVIAPQHLVTIAAPADGNVVSVMAHEGQHVSAGDLLGSMNDWQWRADLAAAQAKYRTAELDMEASLARGSERAGAERAQVEFLRSELARAQSRVDSARLRSPIDGVVATPALQNASGEHLNSGDTFAQVLDLSSAVADVAVDQSDVALVQPGYSSVIKLDSYPQRSWRGQVTVVSSLAQPGDGVRTFSARVPLSNADSALRAGMTGQAKISIGMRPAGYVLLRRPALWLWQLLWNWIGW